MVSQSSCVGSAAGRDLAVRKREEGRLRPSFFWCGGVDRYDLFVELMVDIKKSERKIKKVLTKGGRRGNLSKLSPMRRRRGFEKRNF